MEPLPTPPPSAGGITAAQWRTILHLSPLVGLLLPFLFHLITPLVIWLIKKDEPLLDRTGREVLNFQISFTLYMAVVGTIAFVLFWLLIPLAFPALLFVAWIVLTIVGGVKASNGEDYRYPFTIRLL